MDEGKIILKAAEPIQAEGLVFARYLDQAAEGFFRLILGPKASEILAKAYIYPGHDLSFKNVTFAVRDNVIVGMALGYTYEQHRCSSEKPLREAAGFRVVRLMFARVLFAPLWRVLSTLAAGDFYLQAVAVDSKCRGQGVGSVLIDFMEDRAAAGGSTRFCLDVSGTNKGARRLYERRKMSVESEWPKHISIPGLRIFRMTKTL
jgi:ribosomal protein S18 acetylase RimI-like enzyme